MEVKESFQNWLRLQDICVVNNLSTTTLFKLFIDDYIDSYPAFFGEIQGYVWEVENELKQQTT
jgi:hypothetical protein